MKNFLISCFCYLGRVLLKLRYSIKIEGIDELYDDAKLRKDKGILFLPNHPAHVDPIIITMLLWPKFKIHPIVIEYIYRQSGINLLMRMIKAYSIPNLESSINDIKKQKIDLLLKSIIKNIKNKENLLIYPAGRLKHTGKEILGGASATFQIVKDVKDVNIVLIRTTGLWGSSFSRAYESKSPDFKKTFINAFINLFKCGVFFMPRRKLVIDVKVNPKDFPYNQSKLEINRYLEKWYNQYKSKDKVELIEPLTQVSYSCWKKQFLNIKQPKKQYIDCKVKYSSKIEETVFTYLNKLYPDVKIEKNMNLAIDLGMDSLDVADVVSFLSINYDIKQESFEDLNTVADLLELAEKGKLNDSSSEEIINKFHWPKNKKKRPDIGIFEANTICGSFLKKADQMKNHIVFADDLMGPVSYKRVKLMALVLREKIKDIPCEKIGVLLPASAAAYVLILAILLSNKIPVMLNWTLGPKPLNNMIEKTNLNVILSSWKFLEKLSNTDLGNLIKKIHLLEDIKKNISKKQKLKALFLSYKKSKKLIKKLRLNKKKPTDTAVVLFTSGTESTPKGVPLSHKNILSNQLSTLECFELFPNDIMYGILPPFHSFGFSITGIFPILSGVKVAFYPDPTNNKALAEGIKRWNATIFCAAPSFLKGLINIAKKDQLDSLRLFVSGAEKAPQWLYEKIEKEFPEKKLIEGYGITECSPIISLNRMDSPPVGVGKIIPQVTIKRLKIESNEEISNDLEQEGEICIKGDNVFSGYLGNEKNPFIIIEGEKWYKTGDLGYLKDGFLILSGRLKRFTKIAGEMISLSSIEEVLSNKLNVENENPSIAVCAKEVEGDKTFLILFATYEVEKNFINAILNEAGFSRLIKINQVKHIEEIPIMGTGKIDYRFLQNLID